MIFSTHLVKFQKIHVEERDRGGRRKRLALVEESHGHLLGHADRRLGAGVAGRSLHSGRDVGRVGGQYIIILISIYIYICISSISYIHISIGRLLLVYGSYMDIWIYLWII